MPTVERMQELRSVLDTRMWRLISVTGERIAPRIEAVEPSLEAGLRWVSDEASCRNSWYASGGLYGPSH